MVGVSSQLPKIWSTKQTPYLYSYIAKKSFLKEDDKRIRYKYLKILINVIQPRQRLTMATILGQKHILTLRNLSNQFEPF